MLELDNVNLFYGNIHALKDVSLTVQKGELVALLGANGAGKTSTLRAISAMHPVRSGSIAFEGRDLSRVPAHRFVDLGIAHCPEGRQVFGRLSVRENLALGAFRRRDRHGVKQDEEWVYSLFPVLATRRNQSAGTLSGGEQQMLAIARALMSRPRLLLLDEPSLGLAPLVVEQIFGVIREIKEQGRTVLLVEQNAFQALSIADRAYVLETGRIMLEGTPAALLANKDVKRAYLGG
ncbi:MAG: ABC transporter ATP-binding protein [Bacillota bacterium]|nr:ABC transporter ATP-binding protein [Bacillota bacterium]